MGKEDAVRVAFWEDTVRAARTQEGAATLFGVIKGCIDKCLASIDCGFVWEASPRLNALLDNLC